MQMERIVAHYPGTGARDGRPTPTQPPRERQPTGGIPGHTTIVGDTFELYLISLMGPTNALEMKERRPY